MQEQMGSIRLRVEIDNNLLLCYVNLKVMNIVTLDKLCNHLFHVNNIFTQFLQQNLTYKCRCFLLKWSSQTCSPFELLRNKSFTHWC